MAKRATIAPGGVMGRGRAARLLRQVVAASALCLVIYFYLLARPPNSSGGFLRSGPQSPWVAADADAGVDGPPPEVLDNRSLDEEQCRAYFPGLFKEIDDAVAKGPFSIRPRNESSHLGPLVARIKDGKLYILAYQRKVDLSRDMLQHRSATLHQIANALLTWPSSPSSSRGDDIPDTVIAFNHHDDPLPGTWSYSRPADPALDTPDAHYFAIPHFGFYAWPSPHIVSLPDAARRISLLEDGDGDGKDGGLTWADKDPRAVWRGTAWFNNARAGRARQNLVHAARGQAWADVEALSPSSSSPSNALDIADFCRYRYVVYTEGITYSGRLPFHQLCRSVLLTPPIAWLQPTTAALVRPIFSRDLPGVERAAVPTSGSPSPKEGGGGGGAAKTTTTPTKLAPYPAPWVRAAWPTSYAAAEANAVFVAPDWSDLGATVAWLEAHPATAAGIAARQRALFARRGYLGPAAEACYWRALVRGWAAAARVRGLGWDEPDVPGVPWEEFSLSEVHK